MITERNLPTPFVRIIMSLLIIFLFAVPVSGVKGARRSQLNGGWQIWIEPEEFNRRQNETALKLGSEELLAVDAKPWLAEDVIIALGVRGYTGYGFMEYDFESPQDGDPYIYCRVMDFRSGGSQSWFIVLNSDDHENMGMIVETSSEWVWNSGTHGTLSPTKLKKGDNTIRVVSREARAGEEPLMDVFVVSTVAFEPTDDAFNAAAAQKVIVEGKIVNPEEQFALDISGHLKQNPPHRFRFDLAFESSLLQGISVKAGPLWSDNNGTSGGQPEVDNEKGLIANIEYRRSDKEDVLEDTRILATVTFKAITAGMGKVSLQNLRLWGPDGQEIAARARKGVVNIFPHGSISGVVRDTESGTPISGAKIQVSKDSLPIGLADDLVAYSDGDGQYTLDGVPAGNIGVTVRGWIARFDPESQSRFEFYLNTTTEAHVKQGETTVNVDFEMTPNVDFEAKLIPEGTDGKK